MASDSQISDKPPCGFDDVHWWYPDYWVSLDTILLMKCLWECYAFHRSKGVDATEVHTSAALNSFYAVHHETS